MQRQIVHADDVRRGVDHARLARQAQERRDVIALHARGKARVLCCHAAARARVLRHGNEVRQRVGRAVIAREQRFQRGKKPRLFGIQFTRRVRLVGVEIRGELRRERGQKCFRVRLRQERAQCAMGKLRVAPVQLHQPRRDVVRPQRGSQRGAFFFLHHSVPHLRY